MKRVYFIIFSAIIIGFTLGIIFELNKKGATPTELLNKLPGFIENILSPTSTTVNTKKPIKDWTADLIAQRQSKISKIKQNTKVLAKEKDKKKRKNLCVEIGKDLKSMNLGEKNMKITNEQLKKEYKEELKKMVKEARKKHCNWVKIAKLESALKNMKEVEKKDQKNKK